MKPCPFCAEKIKDAAIKCKHCGEWLPNANEEETSRPKSESAPCPDAKKAPKKKSGNDEELNWTEIITNAIN